MAAEPKIKPDIVIKSYEDFKDCIVKKQEQDEYVNGDKRYGRAIMDLLTSNYSQYQEWHKKMKREFRDYQESKRIKGIQEE